MRKSTGRILAIIGLSLHAVLFMGEIIILFGLFHTFGSMDGGQDSAAAASQITGGVAFALWPLPFIVPAGLAGLALLTMAITKGGARERWVFRWSIIAMVVWLPLIPLGTLIGIAGIILLFLKKRLFGAEDKKATPRPEPTRTGADSAK